MSKAASIVGLGVGGTALSLGGAYMLGAFDSDLHLNIPISLEEFKKEKGKEIFSDYFPDVVWDFKTEGESWAKDKPKTDFLGTTSTDAKSRLVVNWEKFKCASEGDNNSKKSGRIRWLWTFVNGHKGLVLYASAESATSADSKLDIKGVIYVLEKGTETNSKWQIKYNQQSNSSSTPIDSFDDKLPTPSTTFTTNLKVKNYWGFLDSSALTNLCKKTTQDNGTQEIESSLRESWNWTPGTGTDVTATPLDWDTTEHKWLDSFYGTMNPKLSDLFTNFKGSWKEEYSIK